VDLEDTGLLDTERVGEVLEQLGVVVSPEQLEKMVAEYGVDGDGLVRREDFVREQSKSAPTQAVPTAIFYLQTLGLILKEEKFFGLLGALNLDLESATGQCVAPLTTAGRFYTKATLTPLVLVVATAVFAAPLWNLLRRVGLGRIVALYRRSSTSYQILQDNRCLYF
jgi:hypothetical protein